jgi:predicted DsbA family dithiol-disulfide isomerase
VDTAGGLDHEIAWKTFSLEQVNLDPDGDKDALWAEPERRRGLLPGAAAKWAESQNGNTLERVQRAIFEARHGGEREKIGKPDVLESILDRAGLDGGTIVKELLTDRKWLDAHRADHEEADELGVFGVPTLVFPDKQPVFVRLLEITEGDRAVEIYRKVQAAADDPVIHEIKRPTGRR